MSGFNYEEFRSYYDTLMEIIASGEPTLADEPLKVPVTDYTDRDRWKREIGLLKTTPMILAFSTELPQPGSYWAMTRLGVPILLTRLKSGEVRLFINVCRHRGNRVVEEGQGNKPRFTCIYHSWTYGPDGTLLSVPENKLFGDVDKKDHSLTELAVVERDGLIWGLLTPGVSLDLDEFLGPEMSEIVAKCDFGRFRIVDRLDLPAANWKLAYEGFCEAYHLPSLHATTFGSFVVPNGQNLALLGPHMRFLTPVLGIQTCDPSSLDELKRHVGFAISIFPTTFITFASDLAFAGDGKPGGKLSDRVFVNQVLPGDSPEKSVTLSRTMTTADLTDPAIEDETRNWSKSTYMAVRDEDYPVIQVIQEGLLSGAQDHVTVGRNEAAVHHLHEGLRKALGDEPLSNPKSGSAKPDLGREHSAAREDQLA